MAVTRAGYTTVVNTGGAMDFTVSADGTIAEGDWMVMVVVTNQSQVLAVPAGWTAHYNMKVAGTLSTALFTKKRTSSDGSYALAVTSGTLATVSLMWFRGAADAGWVIPDNGRNRASTGTTFNNIADPITTTGSDMMVLTVSTERTSAAEATYTSMTGATPWFFAAQNGSYIETIAVGYREWASPATTEAVTVVYPNTQGSNGYAFQLGIPAAAAPAPPLPPLRLWNGTAEVALTAHEWNGTTESASLTDIAPYNGDWHIADLLSTTPYYIAHRGGGANWPEHTMRSYTSAANYGMKAIEISTLITSDGHIVCHHDHDTLRMTGTNLTIGSSTLAQLSALTNTAANTDNPSQNREPIPLLSDVLDKFAKSHVLFIEPKIGGTWQATLRDLIESKTDNPDRIVWKQPINAGWSGAKAKGFTTWGYVLSGDSVHMNNLDEYINHPDLDIVGVERASSDAHIQMVVGKATAAGKKVIMWEIRSIADRDRALALGCVGMMTSNLRAVLPKFP